MSGPTAETPVPALPEVPAIGTIVDTYQHGRQQVMDIMGSPYSERTVFLRPAGGGRRAGMDRPGVRAVPGDQAVSANLAGVAVTPLGPETLVGLPCPERSLELGFPQAAIEQADGRYLVGPLHLRTSPMEAAVLALVIQDAIGSAAMAEARRLRAHGHAGADTGILTRVLDRLNTID